MKSYAFVFPGQGSQSVGMLDGWGDHPVVVQTLQEASDALGEDVGLLIRQAAWLGTGKAPERPAVLAPTTPPAHKLQVKQAASPRGMCASSY